MDQETRTKLRVAKLALGAPPRRPTEKKQSVHEAKRALRPWIRSVLQADEDCWLKMMQQSLTAAPSVQRLTVDLLIEQLRKFDPPIRTRAVIWLALIGNSAIAALVLKLHKSRSVEIGVLAAETLGQIGQLLTAKERSLLVIRLDAALHGTRHSEVRLACARAMVRVRDTSMAGAAQH